MENLGWLKSDLLDEDEMRRAAALGLGIPFVILSRQDLDIEAMLLIPEPLSRARSVVAYARGQDGSVEVALLDMADLEALSFLHPLKVKPRLTTRASMKQALLQYQKHLKERFAGMVESGVHAVDGLLRHALLSGASHIHIEPMLTGVLVRYRIQGMLAEAMRLGESAAAGLRERLKSLARLFPIDSAAQEGSFAFEHDEGRVAVGVSTLPTVHGEKMHLRLAQEKHGQSGYTLSALGFHGRSLERMHALLHARRGLVAASGEGKTTLVYTMLDELANPRLSLVSVEEEVAHRMPSVWQMRTRPEIGMDIAASMRAALKTDPDVLMVDPLTSPEGIAAAAAAAARGVFVLAATEGTPPEHADAVIELRLMHRLCPHCREAQKPARAELAWFEREGARFAHVLRALKEEAVVDQELQWKDITCYRPVGCERCERGFTGLVGVQAVTPRDNEDLTLLEDALFKAIAGIVTLEEIIG